VSPRLTRSLTVGLPAADNSLPDCFRDAVRPSGLRGGALAAWAEPRPVAAKADRLSAEAGDGVVDVDDDSTLFR
jgi:hypothetical protein